MKHLIVFAVCICASLALELQEALPCQGSNCTFDRNCRCSNTNNPGGQNSPQLISLTFDEAVVKGNVVNYWEPLLFKRKNPDGKPISGTFFVPHEYTDYSEVQKLWVRGFEIGVHTVTKNPLQSYWRNASFETLKKEFGGQRKILSKFAKIPIEQISGARTPQLQLNGDVTFKAYQASNLTYDNSWPTYIRDRFLPYTLDYKSTQKCMVSIRCPKESWKGFWVVPILNIHGDDKECNILSTCGIEGSARNISDWLIREIELIRKGNRAPITLIVNSSWFLFTENAYDAFVKVLDHLRSLKDVFIVSQKQVIEYMKNPVPLSDFKTDTYNRKSNCKKSVCSYPFNNSTRYMVSCVHCPKNYPWLENPEGN